MTGSGAAARILTVLSALIPLTGCNSADAPASPSAPISVEGLWRGTAQVADVQGGACLRTSWNRTITLGSRFIFRVTQGGSVLTGTSERQSGAFGSLCQIRGTLSGSAYEFDLADCRGFPAVSFAACFDGTQVAVRFIDASVVGTVSADRRSVGTLTETIAVEDNQGRLLERMIVEAALEITLPPR